MDDNTFLNTNLHTDLHSMCRFFFFFLLFKLNFFFFPASQRMTTKNRKRKKILFRHFFPQEKNLLNFSLKRRREECSDISHQCIFNEENKSIIWLDERMFFVQSINNKRNDIQFV